MSSDFKELVNSEKMVKMEKPDGTIIQWDFVYTPYGVNPGYWAEQRVNGKLNKENFLGRTNERAVRIWNNLFRHRRDLNEKK